MSWKPKEKDLTLDEAVVLAKKELAPFWFGIAPQIAGITAEGKSFVFPLSPEFNKQSWMVLVVDPTDFSGATGIQYAREWHRRYASLDVNFLVIFLAPYAFLRNPEMVQKYMEQYEVNFYISIDKEQSLGIALGAQELPRTVLLNNNKRCLEYSGNGTLAQAETDLQKYLRTTDPGLPLLQVFRPREELISDWSRVEFGYAVRQGQLCSFPSPGFSEQKIEEKVKKNAPAVVRPKVGDFQGSLTAPLQEGEISIHGQWKQDGERIFTSDPKAWLRFLSPSSNFSLVAESLSHSTEHPLIVIEVGGVPAFEAIAGEHMLMEDSGRSGMAIRKPQLYHALIHLTKKTNVITLKFDNADQAPVAIYGLRFGGKEI